MKTLLIGFEDVEGRCRSKLLAGPNAPESEKSKEFARLKANGEFPEGVTRVELWGEVRGRCAVAICVKAHNYAQELRQLEHEEAAEERKKLAAKAKEEADKKAKAEAEAEEKRKKENIADAKKKEEEEMARIREESSGKSKQPKE